MQTLVIFLKCLQHNDVWNWNCHSRLTGRCGSGNRANSSSLALPHPVYWCSAASECTCSSVGRLRLSVCTWVCTCVHACVCVAQVCPVSPWLTLFLWRDCRERLAKRDMHNSDLRCNSAAVFLNSCHFATEWRNKNENWEKQGFKHCRSYAVNLRLVNKSQTWPDLFPYTVHVVKHLCCAL